MASSPSTWVWSAQAARLMKLEMRAELMRVREKSRWVM
jgi:hypothetical protein